MCRFAKTTLKCECLLVTCLLIIGSLFLTTANAAEITEKDNGNISVSEKYSSKNKNEKYSFDSKMEYKGKTYELDKKSVKSRELSEEPAMTTKHEVFTQTSTGYKEIIEAEPRQVTNDDDGQIYTATVDDIKNETVTIKNRTAEAEYKRTVVVPVTDEPDIEQEWTFDYVDKDNGNKTVQVTASLKEQSVRDGQWEDTEFPITITVNGYGADVISLSGQTVKLGDDVPFAEEYYPLLLQLGNRNNENFRITSTKWDGEAYSDGGVIKRNAIAYTQQKTKVFNLTYGGEVNLPDCDGFKTTITYGYDREVESTEDITYYFLGSADYIPIDEGIPPAVVVGISVGLAVLALAVALILFLVARRKRSRK